MNEGRQLVRRSVLDRLIQSEAHEPRNWSDSVRLHRAAVLRDVEWLLNTRRIAQPASAAFPEVQDSVYHYGLPETSQQSSRDERILVYGDSADARRALLLEVENAIAQFEPRLTGVRVSAPTKVGTSGSQLRLVIEALLTLDTESEPIVFDTVIDPASGRFSVAGRA